MTGSLSGVSLGRLGEENECGPGEALLFGECLPNVLNLTCSEGMVYDQNLHACVPAQRPTPAGPEPCPKGQWLNPYGKCEGRGATTTPAPKPATTGGGGYVAPKPADAPPAPVEAGMSTTSKVAVALVVCAVGLVGYKVAKKRGYLRNEGY